VTSQQGPAKPTSQVPDQPEPQGEVSGILVTHSCITKRVHIYTHHPSPEEEHLIPGVLRFLPKSEVFHLRIRVE
jgi:hypothetical protein